MTDLAKTIAPKSDQLNADDLIGRNLTITVTGVRGCDEAEQPIAISFEGDNGKPYKPCKSMRRVMVHVWGRDGNTYAGRRMALYRDENVQFGGIKVGGIRISHMSHIDHDMTMALTATRAKRTPYTVKPLKADTASIREARRETRAPPAEDAAPREDRDTGYSGGFGGDGESDAPQDASEAVCWMREVFEDLDGDVFRSTADLDAFFADAENIAKFQELQAEDEALAKRLEAALRGRGKALASRTR